VLRVSHPLDRVSVGKIVQIRDGLLAAASRGAKVYRFEAGDPSFSLAPHVREALEAAARAGKTHYVPNDGIPELRAALAEKVRRKNGIAGVGAEDVFVTCGAMQGLFATFGSFLDPGDQVIVPDPMWMEAVENVHLAGGEPVGVPLSAADDFAYDPEAIRAAITPRTAAIFLNSPHNPTGAVLPEETLRAILDIAREHDLWVVSDEAYEDVVYAPARHVSIASLAGDHAHRVVSVFSFSKSHAMAGLRTGYVVTTAPLLHERIPKLIRCTTAGVNSLAQWAALAAVEGDQGHLPRMLAEYEARRDLMLAAVEGIEGTRPFVPRGTFFLWVELEPSFFRRLGVADASELSARLAARGIGTAPGEAFSGASPRALRLAFSCDTEMVREGSALLREALAGGAR
jgi:aspartate aminotransferase